MKPLLLAAAFTLLSTGTAAAQVDRGELSVAVGQLERAVERLGPNRPDRLVEAVRWFRNHLASTNSSLVSRRYLQTLTFAAAALEADPTRLTIDDIADELAAKVDHCETLDIGMGGSVALRVNPRRGAQTVNNWQVFYLLKIYERASNASATAFATLSAPATARLEPGRYWIWARDPMTGRTSERTLLKIAGKQELSVDLPVP